MNQSSWYYLEMHETKHMNKCPGWVKAVTELLSKYMKRGWVYTLCKTNTEPGTTLIDIGTTSTIELLLDDASSEEDSESSSKDESNSNMIDVDGPEKEKYI